MDLSCTVCGLLLVGKCMTTCQARNSLGSTGISKWHKNSLHMEQPGKYPDALRFNKRKILFVWHKAWNRGQIHSSGWFNTRKSYLHSAMDLKMIGNRDGSSFRKNLKYQGKISQTWTASESSLPMLCYHWYWETFLQKLNKRSDITLPLKHFLLVLPVIAMENCFSFSPHSFCFHVYLAFAPKIPLQGSPVHAGYAENDGQKGPCCRKALHEL